MSVEQRSQNLGNGLQNPSNATVTALDGKCYEPSTYYPPKCEDITKSQPNKCALSGTIKLPNGIRGCQMII